jgi:hypothetical protein
MAIDTQAFRLLLAARKAGADFGRTVTFGRQSFYPKPGHAARALARSNVGLTPAQVGPVRHCYGETFLKALGAQTVDSIDASGYEGATIVHDLNQPVPPQLHGQYTVVYDGGTTEHVFHYPQTLLSAMRLLAVGGHFVSITAGNNLSGHGFYQVSPELFFRVFNHANGFETVAVLLAEARPGGRFFRVADPAVLKERIEFIASKPYLVAVIARKVAETGALQAAPQQSDYQQAWQGAGAQVPATKLGREARRVVSQARQFLGRHFYLPWQSRGITALSDAQLYSL